MAAPGKKIYFLIFLLFIIAATAYIFFNKDGVVKYVKLKSQLDSLNTEIQKIDSVNIQVRQEIDSLKNNVPAKIERVAREKYGLIREGEKVYRMKEK